MNRRKAVFLASLWCGTGVYACKEEVPLDPVQLDPRAVAVAEYGDLETGNVLGLVQDASLSPTGRYLAILDRDEPHLWVFDRELDTTHVFGRHGAGPGEIQSPMSITMWVL